MFRNSSLRKLYAHWFLLLILLSITSDAIAEPLPTASLSTRLTDAAVVEKLGLTELQQTSISIIITTRNVSVALAEDADKSKFYAEADTKLRAVLSEVQRKTYRALYEPPLLKFNFRNQKWPEVLNWVAGEADLSLVMESSPQGTFNYKDSKSYTPNEAIDLLNGWLLIKGYTLIKRERLLMCLSLKGGIPEGSIPQITLQELAKRGEFDFVSVLIPLEDRDAETVLANIKPLLGKYGQADSLAATNQMLVSAPVGKIRLIEKLIAKIDVAPDEKTIVVVYPLKNANPTLTAKALKQVLVGTFFVDSKAKQVTVNATAAEQEKAKQIVAQLELNQVAELQPVLELYDVRVSEPAELLQTLQLISPDATFRYDQLSRKLVAFATKIEQVKIEESLKKLIVKTEGTGTPQLVVYPLGKTDPVAAESLVTILLPGAQFAIDKKANSLIAYGNLADHQTIQNLMDQLKKGADGSQKLLKVHQAADVELISVVRLLRILTPEALVTIDAIGKQLLVIATTQDQLMVENVLKQIGEKAKPNDFELKSYPLAAKVDLLSTTTLLTQLVPEAKITADAANRRFLISASTKQHVLVSQILAQVSKDAGGDLPELRFYLLKNVTGTSAIPVLQAMFPAAQVTFDQETQRLSIVAAKSEHLLVAETLKKLEETSGLQQQKTLQFYSIRDLGPNTITVLANAVPNARISAGAKPDQILVVATAPTHEKLNLVLNQLKAGKEVAKPKDLAVYQIAGTDPKAVYQLLQPLVDKDVQLSVDATGKQLFVRTTADKQLQIKKIIDQVTAGLKPAENLSTKPYYIGYPNADEAQEVLLALYPDATIVFDAERKMIIATATPEQHLKIEEVAKQFQGLGLDDNKPYPMVYKTKNAKVAEMRTVLLSLYSSRFERISVAVNDQTGRLIVVARKHQHESIKNLIEQYDSETPEGKSLELEVYNVAPLDGSVVHVALEPLVSAQVKISSTRRAPTILVSAPPEEQKQIRKIIEQITTSQIQGKGITTKTYRLARGEADEAQEVLQAMFPNATLVTDRGAAVLVATATPQQHLVIANVVAQMTGAVEGENSPKPQTYHLVNADGETVLEVLENLFVRADEVRISLDRTNQNIIAIARPDQQKMIADLLMKMDPQNQAGQPRTLEVYPFDKPEGEAFVAVIQGSLKQVDAAAKVLFEPGTKHLVVTTTLAGHLKVRATVDRLMEKEPRDFEVFQLSFLDAISARLAIDGLYLDADEPPSVQANDDAQQLIVRASPQQIQEIRSLLTKMGETNLTQSTTIKSNQTMRTIRIDGNMNDAIKRIEKLWPKLRKNPIRILKPNKPAEPTPKQQHFSVPPEKLKTAVPPEKLKTVVPTEKLKTAVPPEKTKTTVPQENPKVIIPAVPQKKPATAPQQNSEEKQAADFSPVVIMQGQGRLTIASQDTEALDQMEALLRAMFSKPDRGRNRDFNIYQLQNAGATEVSRTLKQIFETSIGALSFGSVILVPEERLNALIVYAGRADRERIEELIQVLDTENIPDTKRAYQTKVIPLEYANASRVHRLMQGIYKTQLATGGKSRNINVPRGVPRQVATLLMQVNAATAAPLLTIEVQSETNSLIIKAPQTLIEELEELVETLELAAKNSHAKGVKLIPLKKMKSERVMQILNEILD